MIRPMDARVVVKKPTRAEQTESGIILPDTVDEGTQTSQGEVLAVGPGSRNMNTGFPMPMDVKVGDRVIYTKYQGVEVNHNGEELFVIMERDIIAIPLSILGMFPVAIGLVIIILLMWIRDVFRMR